jgi:fatty acid hydroxylase family protein
VSTARFQADPIESGAAGRSYPKPIETPLSLERRTALRNELLAETPSWYVPWVHLFVPSLVGITIIVMALSQIRDLRPVEILTVPLVYLFANAFEWWIHGNALHRRNPLAPVLYDQHTPKHHMLYLTDDMAMRDTREYRLVLIPAYGLLLIIVGQLGATSLLWWFGLHNVACLYAATAIGYAVSYEWLHFSYHLPHEHPVAKNPLILRLARHHAVHHDPRIMQRWNLNVTVPLMDYVMGTAVDSVESANRLRPRP